MKSRQVDKLYHETLNEDDPDYVDESSAYSELKVMMSAAGYYVGTSYMDPDFKCEMPGSRDSGYFRTLKEAEDYLALMNVSDGQTLGTRMEP